jgi:hypothetical protein
VSIRFAGVRIELVALGLVMLAVAVAIAIGLMPARVPAAGVSSTLPPAKAAALIEATSGDAAVQMQAVGERAKIINAALPFAGGPLLAARPFSASGDETDQRRALLCLTQAVYYEAGFEPMEGRRAVAQVVLNRMRHPAFPKSVCGVVYQNNGRVCQFSFVCDGALNRAPAAAAWRQAQDVARAALAGSVALSVGSATHYHANYVAPRWAPMLAKVAQLGQHIFYRWPGAWGLPAAFTGRYAGEPRDPLALRPAVMRTLAPVAGDAGENAPLAEQVAAGPPVPRAVNDVGGLLDTSKGWTLSISVPDESESAAAKLIAAQEKKPTVAVQTASAAPVITGR